MPKKKEKPLDMTNEKKPLDMTTDEAIEFLFGNEGAQTLKNYVREIDEKKLKRSGKSSPKHDSK